MPNALARETSPYLLQHADNPVEWYPWGPESLGLARRSGRPILLSIGYSACHWCHVMARESFEDAETARLMNAHFVNVKVDREERPDLDRIYQLAHQLLTQRGGGWPLTMFLAHDDQRPFFGGTYFPDRPRYGVPSFREVLARVAEYYRDHREELALQNAALVQALREIESPPAGAPGALDDAPLRAFRDRVAAQFDAVHGGFGPAPKFPHPVTLDLLLRRWRATAGSPEPDLHALYMATLSLTRMAEGGLYDHLGGGFFRYSVDAEWSIPHFEKMLYDNAALLATYAHAALATGEPLFARIALETAAWVRRDLTTTEGAFGASLDADSEHHEGRFYLWTDEEVRAVLPPDLYAPFARLYGLDRPPNFEGAWHLRVTGSPGAVAAAQAPDPATARAHIDAARHTLLARRSSRIHPAYDDKTLGGWNAMMIRGLAIAARALRNPDLAEAATRALAAVRTRLWRDGRLLATWRAGEARHSAPLDDHVLLADAVLELAQVRWRSDELAFARALLEVVLAHFEDREAGGFWFTADDHEPLIHRPKPWMDEATPAGNGVAAYVLQRYGGLLGEGRYLDAAERTLRAAQATMSRSPAAHASLLVALDEHLAPPEIIILRGVPAPIERWRVEIQRLYAPSRIVLAIPTGEPDLPEALATKPPRGLATAYLCRGAVCSAPIDDLAGLTERLRLEIAP
jgi:hypothetical protein